MMNIFVALALIAGGTNPNHGTPVGSLNVDTKASQIVWKGYKVTGEHTGTVTLKSGSLQMADGVLQGGTFEIDMRSIACSDLEGEWRDKLVGHLNSEDFFNTAAYPTAILKIVRAVPQDTKGNYRIQADLTIKGTTKPVKFAAQVSPQGAGQKATAKIKVDRTAYDIRYGSGSFFDNLGDKTIYDEFDLDVTLVTK